MSDATLAIHFTQVGAEPLERHLDAVADKSAKTEGATDKLATSQKRAGGAIAQMVASIERSMAQLVALQRAQGQAAGAANGLADATSHAVREQEALVRTAGRLNAAHGSAVGSSKALQYATLNLGRQFSDIGVTLASGMNPLMILVQQGPQIAEVFADLKTQGIGAGDAFKQMGAALILGVGIAVGVAASAFAVFENSVDKNTKHATTWGDTWNATIHVIGERIMKGPIGDALKWLGGAFSATMKAVVDGTMSWLDRMVGFWGAAYNAVVANWRNLPQAIGAILVGAANMTIQTVEGMINTIIKAVNHVAGKDLVKAIDLPRIKQASNAVASTFEADAKRIAASSKAWREGFASDVAIQADKEWEERQKKKSKTTRDTVSDYEKAVKASEEYAAALREEVATMGMSNEQLKMREIAAKAALAPTEELARAIRIAGANWEYQTGVMKAFEAQTKSVAAAANDNIKTMAQVLGSVELDTALDGLIHDLETIQRQSDIARNAVDDIYYGIRNRDWAGAFSGLLRTLEQLKLAFDKTANAQSRIGAIAGVAQGVGNAVGGKTGSFISGAGSGAAAGASIGSMFAPGIGTAIGAGIGAIVGGISSLFGSSKAKKQEKAEAEARRLAEEQARLQAVANERRALEIQLMELQGDSAGALAAARADELAKMDASNRALKEQTWALQDAAEAKAKADALAAEAAQQAATLATEGRGLEIQLLEAMGKTDEAAKMRLADERALVDESLRGLFDQVQAERDLTAARDAATEAAQRAKDAAESLLASQQSDAANLVATAKQSLKAAYDAQVSEIKAGRDQMEGYAKSFREFRMGLSGAAESGANFYAIAAKARLGDTDAMGQLVGAAQAANTSALSGASTQVEFLREQARIRAAVQAAEDTATRQVSIADKQLAALEAQVSGFITVNDSVLTIAAGIAGVISAINTLNSTFGGAVANQTRDWGRNPDANMALARQGYAGDFGGGGFQAWAVQQDETTKAKLREILMQQGQAYRIAFASGGVFTSPTDFRMGSQLGQMAEAGPEAIMPLVQTGGGLGVRAVGADNAELKAEIRDLKETVNAALIAIAQNTGRGARAGERHLDLFEQLTDGGDAMRTTEAA